MGRNQAELRGVVPGARIGSLSEIPACITRYHWRQDKVDRVN